MNESIPSLSTMKVFLFIIGVTLVAARGVYEPINTNYHDNVGIPAYERMKLAEAAQDFDGSRIVGGQLATLGTHPHLAGLIIALESGIFSTCGATLVSNTRLVTAAHCWTDLNHRGREMTVVLGSIDLLSGGERVTTSSVQVHSNYNPRNLNNDIAIISTRWISYSNNIRNIALPTGIFSSMTYAGQSAVAAGFGRTTERPAVDNNTRLRHVNVVVMYNWECVNVFGPDVVLDSTICTGGRGGVGICDGDSGGPLGVFFSGTIYLIGVSSYTAASGCRQRLPSGYVRVTSFVNWIQARM